MQENGWMDAACSWAYLDCKCEGRGRQAPPFALKSVLVHGTLQNDRELRLGFHTRCDTRGDFQPDDVDEGANILAHLRRRLQGRDGLEKDPYDEDAGDDIEYADQ